MREEDDVFVGELPRRVVKEQLALGTQRLELLDDDVAVALVPGSTLAGQAQPLVST